MAGGAPERMNDRYIIAHSYVHIHRESEASQGSEVIDGSVNSDQV